MDATCVYCGRYIVDNSNVEVLGHQMHASCEQKFREEQDDVEIAAAPQLRQG